MDRLRILPPEIIDLIIDHLPAWDEDVRACSLVCRAWVASAQRNIFRDVQLISIWPECVERFSQLLQVSPHIGKYVKTLRVEAGDSEEYGECVFVDTEMPSIAPMLTKVSSLILEELDLSEPSMSARRSTFMENFRSVRSLSLSGVNFSNLRHFSAFIVTLPNLEELAVWDIAVESQPEPEGEPIYPVVPGHLHTLSLHSVGGNVVRWMTLSGYLISGVEALSIIFVHGEASQAVVGELLHALGASLLHLGVEISFMKDVTRDIPLAIPQNTSLRTLTLCGFDVKEPTCGWAVDILSMVTSPHMEEIMIALPEDSHDGDLSFIQFERIDTALQTPRYDRLRRVDFLLIGDVSTRLGEMPSPRRIEHIREVMKRKMPISHRRGLLVDVRYSPEIVDSIRGSQYTVS